MAFQPQVDEELIIDGVTYRVAAHPAAPSLPYGQEGRQATVYQLRAGDDRRALKVFKPRFRVPALAGLARRLAAFADLPGLAVCRRTVLTPQQQAGLLRRYPDLTYAVLMPWIAGPTWMESLLDGEGFQPQRSWMLARGLAGVLAGMEQDGLAHCDLSAPNVLLPLLANPAGADLQSAIALVDVEQFYGSMLARPEVVPAGSPGYAHRAAQDGLWGSTADRFAGAVVLAEMLAWFDPRARAAAWGESYFDPTEMQQASERARGLIAILRAHWGNDTAQLFERAWQSETLADCPTFGEWLVSLPEQAPALPSTATGASAAVAPDPAALAVQVLMELGARLEQQGNRAGAREAYLQAQPLAPDGSDPARTLAERVQTLGAPPPAAAQAAVATRDPAVAPAPRPAAARSLARPREVAQWNKAPVGEVSYAPDGRLLALASLAGVYLVEGQTLVEVAFLPTGMGVWSVAFSPDGRLLAAGLADHTIRVWNVASRTIQLELPGHAAGVGSVAFSPDGAWIASAGDDRIVRLWRLADGAPMQILRGHTQEVWSVAFAPDGQWLASGSVDQTVRLWRTRDGAALRTLPGHQGAVTSVALAPGGSILASGAADYTVRLWRVGDGAPLTVLQGHRGSVFSVAFAPDGQMLASASEDRTVRFWRVADGANLTILDGFQAEVDSIAFTLDGALLVSSARDGTVRLWQLR